MPYRDISAAGGQAVVFKAFRAARFVIDLPESSVGAARKPDARGLFTKLSTEFVHTC